MGEVESLCQKCGNRWWSRRVLDNETDAEWLKRVEVCSACGSANVWVIGRRKSALERLVGESVV